MSFKIRVWRVALERADLDPYLLSRSLRNNQAHRSSQSCLLGKWETKYRTLGHWLNKLPIYPHSGALGNPREHYLGEESHRKMSYRHCCVEEGLWCCCRRYALRKEASPRKLVAAVGQAMRGERPDTVPTLSNPVVCRGRNKAC